MKKLHDADQFLVCSPEDRLLHTARPACVHTVSVSDFMGCT